MKKCIPILLVLILILSFSGCGRGDVSKVNVVNRQSGIYMEWEIRSAVEVAVDYFEKEFDGCALLEIGYAGDEKGEAFIEWANQYGVDQVIVLLSSFEVGPEGGDGSLNPNDTYRNWQWVLGRNGAGQWKCLTHGYG